MFQNEQKCYKGNKKCSRTKVANRAKEKKNRELNLFQIEQKMLQREQKMLAMKIASNWTEKSVFQCFHGHLRLCQIGSCRTWYGFERPIGVFCGIVWPCFVLYGLLWYCMALLLSFIAKYWCDLTCAIFSRGHRSKFIWSCWYYRYILVAHLLWYLK